MLALAPQACPASGPRCGLSATGRLRIDSGHGTFRRARLYRVVNREFTVNNLGRSTLGRTVTALAAAGLVLTPALAAPKKRPPAVAVSFDPMSTFTPATADPRLAAEFAGKASSLTDFKFTPAPAKGRPAQ